MYVFEEFNDAKKEHVLFLKGSDRVIFSAAKSLGLDVIIKPIFEIRGEIIYDKDSDTEVVSSCGGEEYEDLTYIGKQFELKNAEHLDWKTYFKEEGYVNARAITWCQPLKKRHPSIIAADYGNQPECGIGYQAAAILVTIPKWSERYATTEDQQL